MSHEIGSFDAHHSTVPGRFSAGVSNSNRAKVFNRLLQNRLRLIALARRDQALQLESFGG